MSTRVACLGKTFRWEVGCEWGALGLLDSKRPSCAVMHGGWNDGVITAALTATPPSPHLYSSKENNVIVQKRP